MKLIIDISKDRYDEIMAMDWKNCRRFFDEELRAIHDGKALEQEPCADMVSRDAMWEVLQRLYGTEGELVEEIMSLPPVLPMPKMGKWIMSDDGLYRPICNRCAAHPWKGYIPSVEEATNVFKFCPNCGANMQEVEG